MTIRTQSESAGGPGAVPVAIVAVVRADAAGEAEILLTKRARNVHLGGVWELPGGKIRPDESPAEAARREVREETGLRCGTLTSLAVVEHTYPDRTVRIHAFLGGLDESTEHDASMLQAIEHQWIAAGQLDTVAFPAANAPITIAIMQRLG